MSDVVVIKDEALKVHTCTYSLLK